jgi:hypothetical protein
MKYLKMLGLAAVAAAALMAFVGAGTASASVLCSTTTTPCTSPWKTGTVMDFSLVGTAKLTTTEGTVLDTCTGGTVKGNLEQGTSTATAKGNVTAANLTWSGCTSTTDTLTGGTLEIHNIAGTSNGTVTAKEFRVTVDSFLGSCVMTVGTGVDLGTLTEGKAGTGSSPDVTLHVNAVVKRESGLCGETALWNATYVLTEPKETTLSVSAS